MPTPLILPPEVAPALSPLTPRRLLSSAPEEVQLDAWVRLRSLQMEALQCQIDRGDPQRLDLARETLRLARLIEQAQRLLADLRTRRLVTTMLALREG